MTVEPTAKPDRAQQNRLRERNYHTTGGRKVKPNVMQLSSARRRRYSRHGNNRFNCSDLPHKADREFQSSQFNLCVLAGLHIS